MTTDPIVGYRIALPPGWARIPLRSGMDETIAAIADAVYGDLPEDDPLAAHRAAAVEQVHRAAVAARDGRGVHLYLPVTDNHGLIVPASFVVAEVAFGSPDPLDPAQLLSRLAADPGAKRVRIDGRPGTRTESVAPADTGRGAPLPSRRIDYLMPFPDDPDRWLAVTFSVLRPTDDEGDLSSTWIELFDAMMTTFRWTHASA